ncbi:MAG TPA: DUF2934 domain-containing protein [Candidatus Acidoferrum sp.]
MSNASRVFERYFIRHERAPEMPTPKLAPTSKITQPKTPRILKESDATAMKQAIHQRVSEKAYYLYEMSGGKPGNDHNHWSQAESQILQRGVDVRESGSWLAVKASLPDVSADDVQVYVASNQIVVWAKKSSEAKNTQPRDFGMTQQELFFVADLPQEVDPSTASAALKEQTLTLMVKKRFPQSGAPE